MPIVPPMSIPASSGASSISFPILMFWSLIIQVLKIKYHYDDFNLAPVTPSPMVSALEDPCIKVTTSSTPNKNQTTEVFKITLYNIHNTYIYRLWFGFQDDKRPTLDLFVNPTRKAELVRYQTAMAKPIKDYIQSMSKEIFSKVNIQGNLYIKKISIIWYFDQL